MVLLDIKLTIVLDLPIDRLPKVSTMVTQLKNVDTYVDSHSRSLDQDLSRTRRGQRGLSHLERLARLLGDPGSLVLGCHYFYRVVSSSIDSVERDSLGFTLESTAQLLPVTRSDYL